MASHREEKEEEVEVKKCKLEEGKKKEEMMEPPGN